jgi:hypothetical protein
MMAKTSSRYACAAFQALLGAAAIQRPLDHRKEDKRSSADQGVKFSTTAAAIWAATSAALRTTRRFQFYRVNARLAAVPPPAAEGLAATGLVQMP